MAAHATASAQCEVMNAPVMNSACCTLFEGDYHYGVGALVNSLYAQGYRGIMWAGYRGALPPWAAPLRRAQGYCEYAVAEGCVVRFVRVDTDRHLTIYKPQFMLHLWDSHCPEVDALFYLDPDVVIKCRWSFFEEWVTYGVALCEDLNSPMPSSHPIRHVWRRLCARHGWDLDREIDMYVSGGFIGLRRSDSGLLSFWNNIIRSIEEEKGGLTTLTLERRPSAFFNTDQDALNMALMSRDVVPSLVGKDGMDFIPGGYIMSHAAGGEKPWRKRFLRSALQGVPPTRADRGFWTYAESPIRLYPPRVASMKRSDLKLGAAVARVIRRS